MADDIKMTDAATASTPALPPIVYYPKFEVATLLNTYLRTKDKKVLDEILKFVKDDSMLGFYEEVLVKQNLVTPDTKLLDQMRKIVESEITKFDEKIKESEENAGDTEVKNAILDKADFYNKIGNKEKALEAYDEAKKKTVGLGYKLDNTLTKIRIGLFFEDKKVIKESIDQAHDELKKGGDWERKNKLKVYEGIYKIMTRDFVGSAKLFLDSVATFTATELVSFTEFICYAVLMSMIGLGRAELKKSVIGSPEILSAIHETPHMKEFLFAYFNCDYSTFMREFVHVIDLMKHNRYLAPHSVKLTRIMRLNVYNQFITSYKSVTIKSMASSFGVSAEFIDREIYGFISTGKMQCKIDKVNGVIETTFEVRDTKSKQYMDIIKEGDNLLNKIQKLGAAIDR